ncbi:hypothetical protein ACH5RR_008960 [Cinchona calisaya]|uniref:RNase H type-1 domain-containing protein n=1 Tax=Cinchona calisaya TaxID=153742 RepID=A0ABD3AI02_9GENT
MTMQLCDIHLIQANRSSGLSFPCRLIVKPRPNPIAVTWPKPLSGTLKLTIDGLSLGCLDHSAGGGILRDSVGNLVFAFSTYFGVATNMEVEATALLVGLQ